MAASHEAMGKEGQTSARETQSLWEDQGEDQGQEPSGGDQSTSHQNKAGGNREAGMKGCYSPQLCFLSQLPLLSGFLFLIITKHVLIKKALKRCPRLWSVLSPHLPSASVAPVPQTSVHLTRCHKILFSFSFSSYACLLPQAI